MPSFMACARQIDMDHERARALADSYIPLAATLDLLTTQLDHTPIIGINGAQGSGKSTLCKLISIVLREGFDKRATTLSIDDIYLTGSERKTLAKDIHPLLATRGVPGTHDVLLGRSLINGFKELAKGQTLMVPVFDKAIDDRLPAKQSRIVTGPVDLVLFEGWCVGAKAQPEETLHEAINSLEKEEDSGQVWRNYVNQQLQQDYKQLFDELDMLIMLKVPDMASVLEWRSEQEQKLAKTTTLSDHKIMDSSALKRFIMHYERLTRYMLKEMPNRADIVCELNSEHLFENVTVKPS